MNKGLFVTGTDTGVGKTLLSCGIIHLLKSFGAKVGVMKPIATGDREDAKWLLEASGLDETLETVNPQFFRAALAPDVAAGLEKREVDLESVYRAFWYMHKKYDVMIVEGVGGVKVPIGETTYVTDLMQALQLPALVVARATLGTINHTLLTLDALEDAKVHVAGVLLNGGEGRTLAERTNLEALQDHVTVPIVGQIPQQAKFGKDPSVLAKELARWPKLVKAVKRACSIS